MGYRSDVKLLIANKGYKKLKEICESSDKDYIREMTQKPDSFIQREDDVLIGWGWVKWYASYEDVGAVESVLRELDEITEENPDLLKDYYYKLIQIGEDCAVCEDTNDECDEFVSDLYVVCDFSL